MFFKPPLLYHFRYTANTCLCVLTNSCVTRLILAGQMPDIDDINLEL